MKINVLTYISASDIISISVADITKDDINVIIAEREANNLSNPALTEAVYYILLSLTEPLHGYGIMQNVEQLSNGRVKLAAGTLYGAITTLLEKGWISALSEEKGSRKKEYIITDSGKEMLRFEISRLKELVENGNRIMKIKEDEISR